MLYHRYIKKRSENNKKTYDDVKKKYEKLCIQKKKQFYQTLIAKYNSNMRRTWGVINDLLGRSKSKERFTSMNVNGEFCSDSQAIANQFNNFFTDIPKKLHEELPKIKENARLEKCMKFLNRNAIKSSVFSILLLLMKCIKSFRIFKINLALG